MPSSPPSDPFQGLPFAALSRILRHIDCYTMRNVLQASHTVRSHSVVLLLNDAHYSLCSGFLFFVPGMQVLDYSKLAGMYTNKITEKFKLLEVVEESRTKPYGLTEQVLADPNTFVHYRTALISKDFNSTVGMGSRVARDWFDNRFSKGFSNYFPINTIEACQLPKASSPVHVSYTQEEGNTSLPSILLCYAHSPSLKSLNISIDANFINIDLPHVEHLTIHFCQPLNGKRLTMTGIYAPFVEVFELRYNGMLPRLFNNVIGERLLSFWPTGYLLSITNVPSTLQGKHEYMEDTHTLSKDYHKADFEKLFSHFPNIVLLGTPPFLLGFMSYRYSLKNLVWYNTVKYPEFAGADSRFTCHLISVKELFTFVNTVPLMALPKFDVGWGPYMLRVVLRNYAPGFSLNGFVDKISTSSLCEHFELRVQLAPEHFGQAEKYVILTKNEVGALIGDMARRSLILEGCYFGDDDNSLLKVKRWGEMRIGARLEIGILPAPKTKCKDSWEPELEVKLFEGWSPSLFCEHPFATVYEIEGAPDPEKWAYHKSIIIKLNKMAYERKDTAHPSIKPRLESRVLRYY